MDNLTSPSNISGCPLSFETGDTMGYNCCFFLNFVPLQKEIPYNFGGTGPILGVKKTSAEGKWACCIWNVLVLCIALSTWILTLEMFSDLIVSELVSCVLSVPLNDGM